MTSNLPVPVPPQEPGRWRVVRDLAVFQLKLFVDGVKDVVLAPISLVAGIYGLLRHRQAPGRHLYRVLRLGRSFDHWVNLYGDAPDNTAAVDRPPATSLDGLLQQVERSLLAASREGGLTDATRQALDRALDGIHNVTGEKNATRQ